MEDEPSKGRVGSEKKYRFHDYLQENGLARRVAYGSLAVWCAGVSLAGIKSINEENAELYNDEASAYIDDINKRITNEPDEDSDTSIQLLTEKTESSITSTSTTIELTPAQRLGLELDPRVESAMSSMENLTPEGYGNFLQSIDSSPVAFSVQFTEFNQEILQHVIDQNESEVFVLHFSVAYANDEPGFANEIIGNFNVFNLITSMAARYGHGGKCCGVNWMIGRAAKTYQTAPIEAKLNHNLPYDSMSTGVEIEAGEQAVITAEQYQQAAYLAVAVLDTQGLLGQRPLNEILQGHGEMRDRIIEEWNATHPPQEHLGVRDDFNFAESELFRHYVQKFLDRNPSLIGQKPLAHLP